MGLAVSLEEEFGRVVGEVVDPENHLHRVLPDGADESFVHANAIDWYGKTAFNYLQLPRFMQEWRRLEAVSIDPEARALLGEIRSLAEQISDTNRLYLVFRGD
jgi:hypothetical protein